MVKNPLRENQDGNGLMAVILGLLTVGGGLVLSNLVSTLSQLNEIATSVSEVDRFYAEELMAISGYISNTAAGTLSDAKTPFTLTTSYEALLSGGGNSDSPLPTGVASLAQTAAVDTGRTMVRNLASSEQWVQNASAARQYCGKAKTVGKSSERFSLLCLTHIIPNNDPWDGSQAISGEGSFPNDTFAVGGVINSLGHFVVAGNANGVVNPENNPAVIDPVSYALAVQSGSFTSGLSGGYLTIYDTTGKSLWTRQLDKVGTKLIEFNGVAIDRFNNIFVSGSAGSGVASEFFIAKYSSDGAQLWTRMLGAPSIIVNMTPVGGTQAFAVAVDDSGNAYLAGLTRTNLDGNTLSGGSQPVKVGDAFLSKYDTNGNKQWTRQFGIIPGETTIARAVSVDRNGDISVVGESPAKFDGVTTTGNNVFVRKYNPAGNVIWSRVESNASGLGVVTDSANSVYLTGSTVGRDLFLSKYTSAGAKQWQRELAISAAPQTSVRGNAITVDVSDNVIVTGYAAGGGLDGNAAVSTWSDFFAAKFNSSGVKQWTRQLGAVGGYNASVSLSSPPPGGKGVAADAAGNIFVAADVANSVDGNDRVGEFDVAVTKWNNSGTKLWVKQFGSKSVIDRLTAVTSDPQRSLFVAGLTGADPTPSINALSRKAFLKKLSKEGTPQWITHWEVSSYPAMIYANVANEALGVTTDSAGNVFVAGVSNGYIDGLSITTTDGSRDALLSKLDNGGHKQWTRLFSSVNNSTYGKHDVARAVAVNATGNVYVVGETEGSFTGWVSSNDKSFFILKTDTAGNRVWVKQMRPNYLGKNASAYAIALDGADNAYVTGFAENSLPGATASGFRDVFVAKYAGDGTLGWVKQISQTSGGRSVGSGIALDKQGAIYVSATGNGGNGGKAKIGLSDGILLKLDSSGALVWANHFGVSGATTSAGSVSVDGVGGIYVTGCTDGNLSGAKQGIQDYFVAKVNSEGAIQWIKQRGATGSYQCSSGVFADSSNNINVVGNSIGKSIVGLALPVDVFQSGFLERFTTEGDLR